MRSVIIETPSKEKIILVFQRADFPDLRKEYPDAVIYFPQEINELYKFRHKPELVQKIHMVKKHFGAFILPKAADAAKAQTDKRGGNEK